MELSRFMRCRQYLERRLPAPLAFLIRQELLVLLALFIVVFGVYSFIEIADEVLEGDSQKFDVWMVENLRKPEAPTEPIGPHWLKTGAVDITSLGSTSVIGIMILMVAGYLALARKFHAMWYMLAATTGGIALSFWMKTWFSRDRPSVVPHLTEVSTTSFPSAHAMVGALVYLTLGALMAQFSPSRKLKTYLLALGVGLAILIGVTRVYLGVHYPTDVLAGWCAGTVWALFCWIIARQLQKRGKVEAGAGDTTETTEIPNVSSSVHQ